MATWNIGINNEGSNDNLDDAKRRATRATKWADDKIKTGLIKSLAVAKSSNASQMASVNEVTAYAGTAGRMLRFLDRDINTALDEMKKTGDDLSDEALAVAKIRIMTYVLKEMMDGVEELRKI